MLTLLLRNLAISVLNEPFNSNGCDCYRTDRKNDWLWRIIRNLRSRKITFPEFGFLEVCAIQMHVAFDKIIVIGMYLPREITPTMFKTFCDTFINTLYLDIVLNQLPYHRLIVVILTNSISTLSLLNIFSGPLIRMLISILFLLTSVYVSCDLMTNVMLSLDLLLEAQTATLFL